MTNLGFCYKTGAGVVRDEAEAVRWYRRAADLGHEQAKELVRRLGNATPR